MEIDISKAIEKIRTAIDDVKGTLDDDFASDIDLELAQALRHSVESLLMELPPMLIEPSIQTAASSTAGNDGAYVTLKSDFLRFLDLTVSGWKRTIYELIEAGSDEEKMQRSKWGRGTNTKPKAMLDTDASGKRILRFWPGSSESAVTALSYVPTASEADGKITCALRAETEKNIIYRAASIFLESKKEGELADKFKQLSTM